MIINKILNCDLVYDNVSIPAGSSVLVDINESDKTMKIDQYTFTYENLDDLHFDLEALFNSEIETPKMSESKLDEDKLLKTPSDMIDKLNKLNKELDELKSKSVTVDEPVVKDKIETSDTDVVKVNTDDNIETLLTKVVTELAKQGLQVSLNKSETEFEVLFSKNDFKFKLFKTEDNSFDFQFLYEK